MAVAMQVLYRDMVKAALEGTHEQAESVFDGVGSPPAFSTPGQRRAVVSAPRFARHPTRMLTLRSPAPSRRRATSTTPTLAARLPAPA